jgi:hypothetical protein
LESDFFLEVEFPDRRCESFGVDVLDVADADACDHGGDLGDFVEVDFVLLFFKFEDFFFESDVEIFVVGFGKVDVFDLEDDLIGVGLFVGLEEASEELFCFFLDSEVSHDEIEEEGSL